MQPTHSWTIRFLACIVAILALDPESARAVTIPGSLPEGGGVISVVTQYVNQFCEAVSIASPSCPGGAIVGVPLTYQSSQGFSNVSVTMNFFGPGLFPAVDPTIQMTDSLLQGGVESSVNAVLTYYFRVGGEGADPDVPVDVIGVLSSSQPSGLPFPVAEASILITPVGGGAPIFNQTTLGTQNINLTALGPLPVLPNTVYAVQISTHTNLDIGVPNCCVSFPTNVSALVDPQIAIDPGFADASLYTIEFSSDSTVPEPATFVTMIAALALAAGARLRRSHESIAEAHSRIASRWRSGVRLRP